MYEDYFSDSAFDLCYECRGYGDDYSFDQNGELVCNCTNCLINPNRIDEWDD